MADRCTHSAAATQELVAVTVDSDDPVDGPLVHLACPRCEAEVWWPAELAGERRCFHCGGELRAFESPATIVPGHAPGHAPAGAEPARSAHAVGLLRRLAEHHRRNAHEQCLGQEDAAAPPPGDVVLLAQARAAHRLDLLAAALDRLHAADVDALRVVIELLAEMVTIDGPADPQQLRPIVERARRAVETLADVLTARDTRV